jgi:hypothetical protein
MPASRLTHSGATMQSAVLPGVSIKTQARCNLSTSPCILLFRPPLVTPIACFFSAAGAAMRFDMSAVHRDLLRRLGRPGHRFVYALPNSPPAPAVEPIVDRLCGPRSGPGWLIGRSGLIFAHCRHRTKTSSLAWVGLA